jgi:hypothetical protein
MIINESLVLLTFLLTLGESFELWTLEFEKSGLLARPVKIWACD